MLVEHVVAGGAKDLAGALGTGYPGILGTAQGAL